MIFPDIRFALNHFYQTFNLAGNYDNQIIPPPPAPAPNFLIILVKFKAEYEPTKNRAPLISISNCSNSTGIVI